MARFQISIRSTLLITAAIAALLATAIELHRRANNFVRNRYRVQYAADLLIEHMEKTGQWPRSWDDLCQLDESNGTDFRWSQWFQEVRRNVQIDFSFDPGSVKHEGLQDEPMLRVIVAYDGTLHGASGDPNTMILRYLQEKLAASSECEQSDGHEAADGPL
jgi:hypothetical protein